MFFIAPFKRRCQSGITIPNARTQIYAKLTADSYYDDGSRATYRCLENFAHDRQSGPLHIQCRNGRWGPRPRCIRTYSVKHDQKRSADVYKGRKLPSTDGSTKIDRKLCYKRMKAFR